MSDERDYKLDIKDVKPPESMVGRPYLSVTFACCGVYQRVYRNPEGTAYTGRCPKCGKSVRFPVGPGGTDSRTFVVY
jgi:hypothetical protein